MNSIMADELGLIYSIFNPNDTESLKGTAECLAETFVGVDIGTRRVSEPMIDAIHIPYQVWYDFVLDYLKKYGEQGLSTIAVDSLTGRVVGAFVSDSFDPEEQVIHLKGDLASLNPVLDYISEIDEKMMSTLKVKLGRPVFKDEYVHCFLLGVRLERNKRQVAINLEKLLYNVAKEKGYKAMFAEATNFKSQKVATEFWGWYVPRDLAGQPIVVKYAGHKVFQTISPEISIECQAVYKPLDPQFDLLR